MAGHGSTLTLILLARPVSGFASRPIKSTYHARHTEQGPVRSKATDHLFVIYQVPKKRNRPERPIFSSAKLLLSSPCCSFQKAADSTPSPTKKKEKDPLKKYLEGRKTTRRFKRPLDLCADRSGRPFWHLPPPPVACSLCWCRCRNGL